MKVFPWKVSYYAVRISPTPLPLPLILPLLQVVPSSEGHQVSVVCRCWVGHTPGTADVRVAQLVGETLQFISCELIVIPQHMIVGGSTGTLGQWQVSDYGMEIHAHRIYGVWL